MLRTLERSKSLYVASEIVNESFPICNAEHHEKFVILFLPNEKHVARFLSARKIVDSSKTMLFPPD